MTKTFVYKVVKEDWHDSDLREYTVEYTETLEKAINVINALTGYRHDAARVLDSILAEGAACSAEKHNEGRCIRYYIYKIVSEIELE